MDHNTQKYQIDLITIYINGLTKYKEQCIAIGNQHKLNKNGETYLRGIKDGFDLSIKYLTRIQKEIQKNEKNENKDNGNP